MYGNTHMVRVRVLSSPVQVYEYLKFELEYEYQVPQPWYNCLTVGRHHRSIYAIHAQEELALVVENSTTRLHAYTIILNS